MYERPVGRRAIVNLCDAMVNLTAEVLRSKFHCVVNPPGEQRGNMRQRLVFFIRPEHQGQLRRLKSGVVDEEGIGEEGGKEAGYRVRSKLKRMTLSRKTGVGSHNSGELQRGQGRKSRGGGRSCYFAGREHI